MPEITERVRTYVAPVSTIDKDGNVWQYRDGKKLEKIPAFNELHKNRKPYRGFTEKIDCTIDTRFRLRVRDSVGTLRRNNA